MRIIDLHCYPSTQEWINCQGPYVEALAKYWKRDWVAKTEAEVPVRANLSLRQFFGVSRRSQEPKLNSKYRYVRI